MENDKEKWIDEVFDSVKGSHRARPNPDLLIAIEDQLDLQIRTISPWQWRLSAAAACLLLALNFFSIRHYLQNSGSQNLELVSETVHEQALISNYKLYDL